MKTCILLLLFMSVSLMLFGQTYDYVQVHIIKAGINDKSNIEYNFGTQDIDSTKLYKSYGLRNIIDAIELLESRGWELINIADYTANYNTLTTANFRRRKTKSISDE